jgi:hypothetical protein
VVGWHKLALNLKAPPLIVNRTTIKDTIEKAEALQTKVLGRFSAEDDLKEDPLDEWTRTGSLA